MDRVSEEVRYLIFDYLNIEDMVQLSEVGNKTIYDTLCKKYKFKSRTIVKQLEYKDRTNKFYLICRYLMYMHWRYKILKFNDYLHSIIGHAFLYNFPKIFTVLQLEPFKYYCRGRKFKKKSYYCAGKTIIRDVICLKCIKDIFSPDILSIKAKTLIDKTLENYFNNRIDYNESILSFLRIGNAFIFEDGQCSSCYEMVFFQEDDK